MITMIITIYDDNDDNNNVNDQNYDKMIIIIMRK